MGISLMGEIPARSPAVARVSAIALRAIAGEAHLGFNSLLESNHAF